MVPLRNPREFALVIALLTASTFSSACTAWHTTSLEPQRFSADTSPELVRLTLSNGTRLTARHPVIVGDSLVWSHSGEPRSDSARTADRVSNIRQVEVHGVDAGATIGLLTLVGGLVALFAVLNGLAGNAGC
jgi:hypothetical protein